MPSGFLIINKQIGKSSYDLIRQVRKKFNCKKAGHTGTLDPLASGVLLVAIKEACRMIEFHSDDDKEYLAEITLGKSSETYDSEGPLWKNNVDKIPSQAEIEKQVLAKFLGKIEQIPPKYSALKLNGQKLCNLTRQGVEFDIQAKKRTITIYENEIISYEWPQLCLRIKCSKGTYIRSIANDLGNELNCGGYLSKLTRTKVSDIDIKEAKTIDEITTRDIKSPDIGLRFGKIEIAKEKIIALRNGKTVDIEIADNLYQVYHEQKFYGILKVENQIGYARKMLFDVEL